MYLKPPKGILIERGDPFARDLIAFWAMNEAGGNRIFDLSGNGFIGSFATSTLNWISGRNGPVVEFLRSDNDYITIGRDVGISSTPFTISALVKPYSISDINSHMGIVAGDAYNYAAFVVDRNTYAARPRLAKQGVLWIGTSNTNLRTNEIVLLTVTYDGTNYAFYRDGQADGSGSNTQTFAAQNTIIGNYRTGNSEGWDGQIKFVAIWARILTQSEIARLYRDMFR